MDCKARSCQGDVYVEFVRRSCFDDEGTCKLGLLTRLLPSVKNLPHCKLAYQPARLTKLQSRRWRALQSFLLQKSHRSPGCGNTNWSTSSPGCGNTNWSRDTTAVQVVETQTGLETPAAQVVETQAGLPAVQVVETQTGLPAVQVVETQTGLETEPDEPPFGHPFDSCFGFGNVTCGGFTNLLLSALPNMSRSARRRRAQPKFGAANLAAGDRRPKDR
jgi:hypothetical protein